MKSPTTTGGSPIPVLTRLTISCRPLKRVSASAAPAGTPTSSAIAVPDVETSTESHRIAHTSASPVTRRRNASRTPPTRTSTLLEILVGLARDGHEERLAVLVDAERLDHRLRVGREHELREGLAARGVHARPVRGVDLHH